MGVYEHEDWEALHDDPEGVRGRASAKITTGDVTVHRMRHTALSRMIEHGLDDHTVMSIGPLVDANAGAL
jgi:integrase